MKKVTSCVTRNSSDTFSAMFGAADLYVAPTSTPSTSVDIIVAKVIVILVGCMGRVQYEAAHEHRVLVDSNNKSHFRVATGLHQASPFDLKRFNAVDTLSSHVWHDLQDLSTFTNNDPPIPSTLRSDENQQCNTSQNIHGQRKLVVKAIDLPSR